MDAFAWIEYFEGSRFGKIVKKCLDESDEVLTHSVTVSEVVSRITRKGFNGILAYHAIHARSRVVTTDSEFAKEVGLLHAELRKKIERFGLADAYILALARQEQGKVLTGDSHFKGMKEVIFLE